jgi:threonine synthase
VFAEPAGATGYAGLAQAVAGGLVDPTDHVVVVVTGNGLKDVPSAMRATGQPVRIDPMLSEVERAMRRP